jgi:hypothetical protein
MATVEEECFLDRVERIAAGQSPQFEYYLNSDRDFSHHEIGKSIKRWIGVRQAILDFVRALPEKNLELTGFHDTYGEITVINSLEIMLEHDQEHLEHLKTMIHGYRRQVE